MCALSVHRTFVCNSIGEQLYYFKRFLACRSRQASIVLERHFRFEVSLLSILCMLWRWEPVEFRAIPILLRKLPNIS